MQFPNDFNLKMSNVFKIAGLVLVVAVVIAVVFRLIGSSLFDLSFSKNSANQIAPYYESDGGMAYDKTGSSIGLSVRNVAPTPMAGNTVLGDDAEEFEVTEYNANIETRNLKDTCDKVATLKSRSDVIFENSSIYEQGCNYNFKVKQASVAEILTTIKALDPRDINENTYTIKSLVDDYTSEVEILEKKMSSIEETLANAVKAYNDITDLATKTKDVENLAKIIDSKINIIERLTQERINISTQLERLGRSKMEQLDRLDYTYFNVSVSENKFIDGQALKDSWKAAIKSFVYDINGIVQGVTVNLVAVLLVVLQYLIYLFAALIIAKFCWQLAKRIWTK